MPGSQIIVCTDGEANLGVGSIKKGDKSFYAEHPFAIETETTINMILLQNPWLRTDLSNGTVSIADPLTMENEVLHL